MDTVISIDPDTDQPWRSRFDAKMLLVEERMLQAACYIVCAYLTGMRDAEVQAMRAGCLDVQRSEDGLIERYRIRSTIYKQRVSIMQIAIDRVMGRAGERRPDTIVYVGDGIWDARACQQLKVPFVGIAAGGHAETLRAEGAAEVFPDYSEMAAFCTTLALTGRPFVNRPL